MRLSIVLAAALLLVGAGCDDVSKLDPETGETKPEVSENTTVNTPEIKTDDSNKREDDTRKDDREESDDGDENTTATQPTVKPTETKPVVTAPTETTGPKTYTMAEVQAAAAAGKCLTVINGGVYDLTNFTNKHPGGAAAIKSLCGINGTAKFQAMHGGDPKPEKVLAGFYQGALK